MPEPQIKVPCSRHTVHALGPLDVARLVAVLTVDRADNIANPVDDDPVETTWLDEMVCPVEALSWAGDSEMYLEHVEETLLGCGIATYDTNGELVKTTGGGSDA